MSHSLQLLLIASVCTAGACVDPVDDASTAETQDAVLASCRGRSDGLFDCSNLVGARIFASKSQGSAVIDHLRTNPSFFFCRSEGDPSGGGPHPDRWAKTVGDDHGRTGWVRDIDIASETNPLPVCGVPPGGGL